MFISVHGVIGSGPRSPDEPPRTKLHSRAHDRPAIDPALPRYILRTPRRRVNYKTYFFPCHSAVQIQFIRYGSKRGRDTIDNRARKSAAANSNENIGLTNVNTFLYAHVKYSPSKVIRFDAY